MTNFQDNREEKDFFVVHKTDLAFVVKSNEEALKKIKPERVRVDDPNALPLLEKPSQTRGRASNYQSRGIIKPLVFPQLSF